MLYMITYTFDEYVPGAYDDFFDALSDFALPHASVPGGVLIPSTEDIHRIACQLGALLHEGDALYISQIAYDRFAGTISPEMDRFIAKYHHNTQPLYRVL